jgi:small subunit ribosomal protein S16
MAVKIRLTRHGRKARPFYHIVAADSRAPRDGKYIEKIGTYNPMVTTQRTVLEFERALHWLQVGAEPTPTVRNILQTEGVLYMKHLLGGVKKGAFGEEEVEKRFQAWVEEKRKKDEDVQSKLSTEKQAALTKRLEEEKAINQKREEEIAKRNSELAAEAEAASKAAEVEKNPETTEEPAEEPKAEAEVKAEKPAEEEVKEEAKAEEKPAKEEVKEEPKAEEEAKDEPKTEEKPAKEEVKAETEVKEEKPAEEESDKKE